MEKLNKRGAAGGLRRFIIAFLFVIAFSFLIIFFITSFLQGTNPTNPLISNNKYGLNSSMVALNSSMVNFARTVNDTQATLADADTSKVGTFLFLIFEGAFQIPKAILGFIGSGITSLTQMMFGFNGNSGILSFIIPLVLAVIVITGVFLIVKAIRTGESEY